MKPIHWTLAILLSTNVAYASFSIDLPIVTHSKGVSTTFYTALDITNNTTQSVDVNFEYVANDLSVVTGGTLTTLGPHGNFHTDDLLPYLASQAFMTPSNVNGFGTLLLTFVNASFTTGTEASATVRIYNYLNAGQKPSVGLAYRGKPLRRSGSHVLTSVINNTTGLTDSSPSVITNAGLENLGIDDSGNLVPDIVTLKATFYDPRTGNVIGRQPTFVLAPGQMLQINDVWKSENLPGDATAAVMTVTETTGTAQIRGYVVVKDSNTNDGSFFFMN